MWIVDEEEEANAPSLCLIQKGHLHLLTLWGFSSRLLDKLIHHGGGHLGSGRREMEREKEPPFSEVRKLKKVERTGESPSACPKIQQGGGKCTISPKQCYPIDLLQWWKCFIFSLLFVIILRKTICHLQKGYEIGHLHLNFNENSVFVHVFQCHSIELTTFPGLHANMWPAPTILDGI